MARGFCPYCGNTIRDKDQFCIGCGKPMLSNVSTTNDNSKTGETQSSEAEPPEDKKKGKKTKKAKTEDIKEQEEKKEPIHLPEEVKEFYAIKTKKKILYDKLNNFQKLMRGSRYELDEKFARDINIQIKAAQTLVTDIKQKENELMQSLDDKYILKKLKKNIKDRREQLKNITMQKKLKKMDKDVFENLRETYKGELVTFEANKVDLNVGLKTWNHDLKMEKVKLENEKKILKGRFSAKEITDENEYRVKDNEMAIKIKNLSIKIETLDKLVN